jgi:hypothetical protein
MQSGIIRHLSSYRDPSGFLFYSNDILYRQVNLVYKKDFDQFISGGLYDQLVYQNILIPHKTINENLTQTEDWYQTLEPELLPFISYPYEWCFEMLKDAALITIEAAKEAMKYQMMLKDASAYNVQWHNGKMRFIDTLSFEIYDEQKPWIAYRQFCEQFLAPLALMHYLKTPIQNLILAYAEGIPLSITQKLLPFRSKFNLNIYLHLHLQATIANNKNNIVKSTKDFSVQKLKNLLRSLEESIQTFSLNIKSGVWSTYYEEAFKRVDYITIKKEVVHNWINKLSCRSAIDLGANEGEFSLLTAVQNIYTISTDFDHYAINQLYKRIKSESIKNIHPLLVDLSNPTPAIGVNNQERMSFLNRVHTDLVMALALIHHLCIGRNIPFVDLAKMFRSIGNYLIIEFVPKEDDKIKQMLQNKKDVYQWYTKEHFLNTFSTYFKILESKEIGTTNRTLYLMKAYEN